MAEIIYILQGNFNNNNYLNSTMKDYNEYVFAIQELRQK